VQWLGQHTCVDVHRDPLRQAITNLTIGTSRGLARISLQPGAAPDRQVSMRPVRRRPSLR
jgi:hypothetical protein